MSPKNKAEKRKAKLKARKQQIAFNEQSLSARLSCALEKLCEPIMPEYIDDSNGPDLVGRRIVWRMGQIAWNIVVTGRRESVSEAFQHTQLNAEQQETVRNEIIGLIKRKISDFPTQRTAIRDFSVLLVGGVPRVKVRPGDTFPKIPFPEFYAPQSEPEAVSDITPDVVRALRKSLKLTQIQFGEIFGITSKKVSAWEHGKAEPTEEQKQKIQSLLKENNEQERETR